MSRFFKSAAFPILIVRGARVPRGETGHPGSSNSRPHSYQTLVAKELP